MDTMDLTRCPLCGAENQCAIAAGRPPATCWCMSSPALPAALAAKLPPGADPRCVCITCLHAAQEEVATLQDHLNSVA